MFAVWFAMLTARLFGLFDYVVLVWYLLFELFCLGIVAFWLMGVVRVLRLCGIIVAV